MVERFVRKPVLRQDGIEDTVHARLEQINEYFQKKRSMTNSEIHRLQIEQIDLLTCIEVYGPGYQYTVFNSKRNNQNT